MFIQPMLLETIKEPFDSEHHIFQPKIDGHRLIWTRIGGVVRIYTRHRTDVTKRYPELWDLPLRQDGDVILDGEGAVLDPGAGREDFDMMQDRFRITKPDRIPKAMLELPVTFFPFDILYANGADLRALELTERLKHLDDWIGDASAHLQRVITVDGAGTKLFDVVRAHHLEGMVAKRKKSRYVGNRSNSWLKIINEHPYEVWVTGIRREPFALLAGIKEESGLLHRAGVIEHGFKPVEKKAFRELTQPFIRKATKEYDYLEPVVRCKVRARGMTYKGALRIPVFERVIAVS